MRSIYDAARARLLAQQGQGQGPGGRRDISLAPMPGGGVQTDATGVSPQVVFRDEDFVRPRPMLDVEAADQVGFNLTTPRSYQQPTTAMGPSYQMPSVALGSDFRSPREIGFEALDESLGQHRVPLVRDAYRMTRGAGEFGPSIANKLLPEEMHFGDPIPQSLRYQHDPTAGFGGNLAGATLHNPLAFGASIMAGGPVAGAASRFITRGLAPMYAAAKGAAGAAGMAPTTGTRLAQAALNVGAQGAATGAVDWSLYGEDPVMGAAVGGVLGAGLVGAGAAAAPALGRAARAVDDLRQMPFGRGFQEVMGPDGRVVYVPDPNPGSRGTLGQHLRATLADERGSLPVLWGEGMAGAPEHVRKFYRSGRIDAPSDMWYSTIQKRLDEIVEEKGGGAVSMTGKEWMNHFRKAAYVTRGHLEDTILPELEIRNQPDKVWSAKEVQRILDTQGPHYEIHEQGERIGPSDEAREALHWQTEALREHQDLLRQQDVDIGRKMSATMLDQLRGVLGQRRLVPDAPEVRFRDRRVMDRLLSALRNNDPKDVRRVMQDFAARRTEAQSRNYQGFIPSLSNSVIPQEMASLRFQDPDLDMGAQGSDFERVQGRADFLLNPIDESFVGEYSRAEIAAAKHLINALSYEWEEARHTDPAGSPHTTTDDSFIEKALAKARGVAWVEEQKEQLRERVFNAVKNATTSEEQRLALEKIEQDVDALPIPEWVQSSYSNSMLTPKSLLQHSFGVFAGANKDLNLYMGDYGAYQPDPYHLPTEVGNIEHALRKAGADAAGWAQTPVHVTVGEIEQNLQSDLDRQRDIQAEKEDTLEQMQAVGMRRSGVEGKFRTYTQYYPNARPDYTESMFNYPETGALGKAAETLIEQDPARFVPGASSHFTGTRGSGTLPGTTWQRGAGDNLILNGQPIRAYVLGEGQSDWIQKVLNSNRFNTPPGGGPAGWFAPAPGRHTFYSPEMAGHYVQQGDDIINEAERYFVQDQAALSADSHLVKALHTALAETIDEAHAAGLPNVPALPTEGELADAAMDAFGRVRHDLREGGLSTVVEGKNDIITSFVAQMQHSLNDRNLGSVWRLRDKMKFSDLVATADEPGDIPPTPNSLTTDRFLARRFASRLAEEIKNKGPLSMFKGPGGKQVNSMFLQLDEARKLYAYADPFGGADQQNLGKLVLPYPDRHPVDLARKTLMLGLEQAVARGYKYLAIESPTVAMVNQMHGNVIRHVLYHPGQDEITLTTTGHGSPTDPQVVQGSEKKIPLAAYRDPDPNAPRQRLQDIPEIVEKIGSDVAKHLDADLEQAGEYTSPQEHSREVSNVIDDVAEQHWDGTIVEAPDYGVSWPSEVGDKVTMKRTALWELKKATDTFAASGTPSPALDAVVSNSDEFTRVMLDRADARLQPFTPEVREASRKWLEGFFNTHPEVVPQLQEAVRRRHRAMTLDQINNPRGFGFEVVANVGEVLTPDNVGGKDLAYTSSRSWGGPEGRGVYDATSRYVQDVRSGRFLSQALGVPKSELGKFVHFAEYDYDPDPAKRIGAMQLEPAPTGYEGGGAGISMVQRATETKPLGPIVIDAEGVLDFLRQQGGLPLAGIAGGLMAAQQAAGEGGEENDPMYQQIMEALGMSLQPGGGGGPLEQARRRRN